MVESQITLLELWEVATNERPVNFGSVCSFYSIQQPLEHSTNNLKCIYLAALEAVCTSSILPATLVAGLSAELLCVLQSKMLSYYWQRDLVSLWLVP